MNSRLKTGLIAAAIVAGLAGGGAAIAGAAGGEDRDDTPITGDALQKASDAALKHTGEGRVTDTEVGDEDGYYEVEVTRGDGSQVDVHLDAGFKVIGTKADEESGGGR
jgi:uncharacterized membrane protein YkoI